MGRLKRPEKGITGAITHPVRTLKKLTTYALIGYGVYCFGGGAVSTLTKPEADRKFSTYVGEVIKRADDPIILYGNIAREVSEFREGYNKSMEESDYKKIHKEVIENLEKLRDATKNKKLKDTYQRQIDEIEKITPEERAKLIRMFEAIGEGFESAGNKGKTEETSQ
ncbi:MAG: hypothetical protein ABIH25_04080 [Candidatus Woesearchaeota archaeon]